MNCRFPREVLTMSNGVRQRVFYLVHRFPYPPDKGDRIRAFHIIEHLHDRCDLTVVAFDDSGVPQSRVQALARYCDRLEVIPASRWRAAGGLWHLARGRSATCGAFRSARFVQAVRDLARSEPPDAVLLSASGLAEMLEIPELRPARTVVDFVDLDSEKWAAYADRSRRPLRWIYAAEASRLRAEERRLMRRADAVTLVTEAEARLCQRRCGPGPVEAVTNGVRLGPAAPLPQRDSLVFIGALDYRPNVEGLLWFCEQVWPEVHRRHPELVLRLVGRAPHRSLRRLRTPGIELIGAVDDVRPYLDGATISIAPLQIARGLQNKVLEALAAGRAVVASAGAAEGIMAKSGRDFLVAKRPGEWVAAVDRLVGDRQLQRQLGQAGRNYVEWEHDWSRCLQRLSGLLGLEPEMTHEVTRPAGAAMRAA